MIEQTNAKLIWTKVNSKREQENIEKRAKAQRCGASGVSDRTGE
jgi:hypothetical protein